MHSLELYLISDRPRSPVHSRSDIRRADPSLDLTTISVSFRLTQALSRCNSSRWQPSRGIYILNLRQENKQELRAAYATPATPPSGLLEPFFSLYNNRDTISPLPRALFLYVDHHREWTY